MHSKSELRRTVLAGRAAMDPAARGAGDEARTAAVLAAVELLGARCVTCYLSVGTEPDTSTLLSGLAAARIRVLLPHLRADGALEWVLATGRSRPGLRGVPEPVGPSGDAADAQAWLVPALAVDPAGTRLGRGGGSYDRALGAVLRHGTAGSAPNGSEEPASSVAAVRLPVVALLHAGERTTRPLPVEPHDRPVTHVAEPGGLTAVGAG